MKTLGTEGQTAVDHAKRPQADGVGFPKREERNAEGWMMAR